MSAAAIEVIDLQRRFGRLRAVDGVSFTIQPGKVVGFIGANGAGKTTTMRIMCTLESADAGVVRILGHDVAEAPDKIRALVGWMPDAFGRYKHMVVEDYLDFFARAYGLRGAARRERLAEVAAFTELDRIRGSRVDTLSKGQSQRLSLARTLLNDPQVLVLDEPAAGLDPKARVEFKNLVQLLAQQGKTIFISSHILSELDEVCDSLLFIDRGKLLYHGDSKSLKNHASGRSRLEIRTLGAVDTLVAWLSSRGDVEIESSAAERCGILIEDDLELQRGLLRAIVEAGFAVVEYRRHERKLEEAFIHHLGAPGTLAEQPARAN